MRESFESRAVYEFIKANCDLYVASVFISTSGKALILDQASGQIALN
jgi:hypothetical protein